MWGVQLFAKIAAMNTQPGVPHREAFGPVARAHPAQEALSVPQRLEALDDDGRGKGSRFRTGCRRISSSVA
jgi:hypothetical protein